MSYGYPLYVKSGSGACAYKASTGARIYRNWTFLPIDGNWYKQGTNFGRTTNTYVHPQYIMPTAVDRMKVAGWTPGYTHGGAKQTYNYFSNPYFMSTCYAWAGLSLIVFPVAWYNKTINKINMSGLSYIGGSGTISLKFILTDSGASTDWTFWTTGCQFSGNVPVGGVLSFSGPFTCKKYIMVVITLNDYGWIGDDETGTWTEGSNMPTGMTFWTDI
jgi:hypothetical protein